MEISELVNGWAEGWHADTKTDLRSIFTEDCVYEDMALGLTHKGLAEVAGFREQYVQVFPDLTVDDISYFTDGENVSTEWVMSGTQAVDLPGIPSQGRSFTVRGTSILKVVDGRFAICRDYWDSSGYATQLNPQD